MTSFFGKLKSGTPSSPSTGTSPSKKDAAAPQQTPLERMLMNAGPVRNDGSDKFFGMENFGNTCYCNSILQCLYYSVPFRDNVLSYPKRSALEVLTAAAATAVPRPPIGPQAPNPNGVAKKPLTHNPARNSGVPPLNQQQKPEDKDSPEYKKKQALIAGPILNMSYQNAAACGMSESLFTALKDIFEALVANQSRMGVISPNKFLEVLRRENEMFRSSMHQDAHEFLNLLLNQVVESVEAHAKKTEANKAEKETDFQQNGDIEKSPSSSVAFVSSSPPVKNGTSSPNTTRWVHELFEGTLTSETKCLTCENVSQRDEAFLDLSVDLDQHSSVTSCLRRFSEEEMLCERNKFHCDNCGGLQEAEKRMKIKRLPKILALHLKRFKYTEDLQRLQKLFHKVVYPYHLRLFNTTDDAEDPDRLYELYAVVVHIGGGPYHGHYVAIIKTQDRGWLLFDDEMVEPVDKSYVRNFFGDRPGMACAYVLFYQETTPEAVQKEQEMEGKAWTAADEPVGLTLKINGSAELHRVQSATTATPQSADGTVRFANLDHAITAPLLHSVSSPMSTGSASTATSPLSPFQSRKEKTREEKERRAAEKEKEKAEKQKRKDPEFKIKDMQRRQDADSKVTFEVNKPTKAEDDKLVSNDYGAKEGTSQNGTSLPGLDIFKRSKSIKFGSMGRKDKPTTLNDDTNPPTPAEPIPDKDKKNRFSIRKRSFGMHT